jgi:F-type H+-transporting ATPase subunit b
VRPVSSLLDRFRRSAGVPAAADEGLEGELVPVFAALEEIEAEAQRLLEEGAGEAERRRAAGAEDAEQILARWRRRAEEARARAEAEHRRDSDERVRALQTAAEAEAREVRARGLERVPALVSEIVDCVRQHPA